MAAVRPIVIYSRKSKFTGKGESIENQIEMCRQYIRLQFGDWVALDAEEGSYFGATPTDLTCTAYYAYSSGIFSKIAGVLGRAEDEQKYRALHDRIVKVFQEHYFDAEGNMTAQTQTAHIVALYFGLTPEQYREKTADALVRLLEKENAKK